MVVYIVLGILAFRIGRASARGPAFWVAALAVFGFIYSVARTHDPLGVIGAVAGG